MDSNLCYELFHCTKCGDCCNGYGGTYVTEKDLENIASFIGKDVEFIKENYCDQSSGRYMIGQKKDGYCVFWDKVCQIHPVKPKMCRVWPYLNSILVDPSNWNIMAGSCPGMRPESDDQVITQCVNENIISPSEEDV